MTDSENSRPQDDSDEDIYKDIPEFNFEDELAKLEGSKETYKQEACNLSEKVKLLTQDNKELKRLNEVLKKNLSTLLKTAQAEVQRKDSMIEELRSKVELLTCRRSKKSTSEKSTKTDDLIVNPSAKQELEKKKNEIGKKRSKSYENWTSSDSEWKCNQGDESRPGLQPGKERNSNCDEKKSDYYRENALNSNIRHSESNRDTYNEKHKERKSAKYEDSSNHRRSFRENYRDHLLCDSYDKKRHSRSSDNRFLPRRRSSRERRCHLMRSHSRDRRKRSRRNDDSPERSRRQDSKKVKSRSWESKESAALEKPISRFFLDNGPIVKEEVVKPEVLKDTGEGVENQKRPGSAEKKRSTWENVLGNRKNNYNKEKDFGKSDNPKNLEIFSMKSPLDALYNDMIASRSSRQFSSSKESIIHSESGLAEGEVPVAEKFQKTSQIEEDWILSFKNERPNETKPMTLYSRRMMRKFSSELKEKQLKSNKVEKETQEKNEHFVESKSAEKIIEAEKEPGELTDDENLIESSKEFLELTKVAAIESERIKKPPIQCSNESLTVVETTKIEPLPKDNQREIEKFGSEKEEFADYKDIESIKETCDFIEFSPFKNNYKLIEISPTKSTGNEHVLEFCNKKVPATNVSEQTSAFDSLEVRLVANSTSNHEIILGKGRMLTSGDKNSWRNSSNNVPGTELKVIMSPVREKTNENEKAGETVEIKVKEPEIEENKELTKKEKGTKKKKKSKASKKGKSLKKGKKPGLIKEPETHEILEKRKRKYNEESEEQSSSKKTKLEKNEPLRKSMRSKRNSKSEPESQLVQKMELKLVQELENKLNNDISSGKFFKPITGPEGPEAPANVALHKCPAADYKMTATMSVTGVVRLETPDKCIGNLKNLMINEQMIFNILDSKTSSQLSPLIGSKSIEMTPRRMLKNDLMLTDSEEDSGNIQNGRYEEVDEVEKGMEVDKEEKSLHESEYSDCGSDSGASDFVDLL